MSELMKLHKKGFLIILFLLASSYIFSQTKKEVFEYKTIFDTHQHKSDYSYAKKVNNEVDAIFSGLFLFYKYFLSSQDKASCVFEPSCSEYAIKSIQKKGIVIGGLQAIDRLTRCNPFAIKYYPIDPKTRQLYDPVE